jgi:phosphoketolase
LIRHANVVSLSPSSWAARFLGRSAFDDLDLIVACVVGDGEAETGPLATGWHGDKFLNPAEPGLCGPVYGCPDPAP